MDYQLTLSHELRDSPFLKLESCTPTEKDSKSDNAVN